jgi:molecular chaperone IbpA
MSLKKEDVAMRTLDLSPLWRSTVGFDRLFDLIEDPARWTGEDNYPPYNIERLAEDQYQIVLALAGFSPDDLTITAEQNVLTVEGRRPRRVSTITCTRGSRHGRSGECSTWLIMSR